MWTIWHVLTARGAVKVGKLPSWTRPLYFGLREAWKDQVLADFIASGMEESCKSK